MSAISLGADLSGQRCDAQVEVRSLLSDRLSHFRTSHEFTHYAEFTTAEEYCFLASWAAERRLPLLILANGSNVFFATKRVKTLVAKNRMPQLLHDLGGGRFEAASSVPLSKLLRCCERDGLDSFYYLASVPATVGGAVAMNAGRGIAHGKTVFDFVESVTYIEEGQFRTLPKDRIAVSYRSTPFAECSPDSSPVSYSPFRRVLMPQGKRKSGYSGAKSSRTTADQTVDLCSSSAAIES